MSKSNKMGVFEVLGICMKMGPRVILPGRNMTGFSNQTYVMY
jgi:hypothetical protein